MKSIIITGLVLVSLTGCAVTTPPAPVVVQAPAPAPVVVQAPAPVVVQAPVPAPVVVQVPAPYGFVVYAYSATPAYSTPYTSSSVVGYLTTDTAVCRTIGGIVQGDIATHPGRWIRVSAGGYVPDVKIVTDTDALPYC